MNKIETYKGWRNYLLLVATALSACGGVEDRPPKPNAYVTRSVRLPSKFWIDALPCVSSRGLIGGLPEVDYAPHDQAQAILEYIETDGSRHIVAEEIGGRWDFGDEDIPLELASTQPIIAVSCIGLSGEEIQLDIVPKGIPVNGMSVVYTFLDEN